MNRLPPSRIHRRSRSPSRDVAAASSRRIGHCVAGASSRRIGHCVAGASSRRTGGWKPPLRRRWSSLRSRCAAFTLIELLVTLAVIALLIAIAVPAVMSMRESSRRMECASRLKQFGLALQNFEAAHRYYPAGTQSNQALSTMDAYSPFVYLLPYLDQAPLYQKIDFTHGGAGLGTAPPYPVGIADQVLPVLQCPSDGNAFGANYRFCTGASAIDWHHFEGWGDGAFPRIDARRPQDFTDGMSHTIGMSEKLKSSTPDSWRPREHFWHSGIVELLGYYPDTDVIVETCASLSSAPAPFGWWAGNGWLSGGYDFTLYNHAVPPNSPIADCSMHTGSSVPPPAGSETDGGVFAARSYHSGGVNCLLMDGSSRFVNQSIDLHVWRALATIAGGESIGEW